MLLKKIKELLLVENVLGIYRNYSFFPNRARCLIRMRILIEGSFMLIWYLYRSYIISNIENSAAYYFSLIYTFSATMNSFTAVVASYFYSDDFKKFMSQIEAFNDIFKDCKNYQCAIKKHYRRFRVEMLTFIAIHALLTAFYIYDRKEYFKGQEIVIAVSIIFEICLRYRFYCGILVFYWLVEIIVVDMEFVNSSISEAVERLKGDGGGTVFDDELWGLRGKLDKWGQGSQLMAAAGELLSKFFGVQMGFSSFTMTVAFIMILHQRVAFLSFEGFPSPMLGSFVLTMVSLTLMTVFVARSGQRALAQAQRMKQVVAELSTLLVWGAEAAWCARAAAALSRRLRAAPLRVRLLGARAVRAAMLVDMLAVVANYTVVLLQFNHVV